MAEQGLLDFLAEKSRCAYLSELRDRQKDREISRILKKINAESFSTKDWQDALEYFTDVREEIQDKKVQKRIWKLIFQENTVNNFNFIFLHNIKEKGTV